MQSKEENIIPLNPYSIHMPLLHKIYCAQTTTTVTLMQLLHAKLSAQEKNVPNLSTDHLHRWSEFWGNAPTTEQQRQQQMLQLDLKRSQKKLRWDNANKNQFSIKWKGTISPCCRASTSSLLLNHVRNPIQPLSTISDQHAPIIAFPCPHSCHLHNVEANPPAALLSLPSAHNLLNRSTQEVAVSHRGRVYGMCSAHSSSSLFSGLVLIPRHNSSIHTPPCYHTMAFGSN